MNYLIAGCIGLVAGVTSGLFGVGAGVIMVPAMMFLLQMPIDKAVGTSLAVMIPTALIGTLKHHTQGTVNWQAVFSVVPLAVAGAVAGAWLVTKIPAADLKRAFGGFLVLVGLRLIFFK